jgi:hypothetical protein
VIDVIAQNEFDALMIKGGKDSAISVTTTRYLSHGILYISLSLGTQCDLNMAHLALCLLGQLTGKEFISREVQAEV